MDTKLVIALSLVALSTAMAQFHGDEYEHGHGHGHGHGHEAVHHGVHRDLEYAHEHPHSHNGHVHSHPHGPSHHADYDHVHGHGGHRIPRHHVDHFEPSHYEHDDQEHHIAPETRHCRAECMNNYASGMNTCARFCYLQHDTLACDTAIKKCSDCWEDNARVLEKCMPGCYPL